MSQSTPAQTQNQSDVKPTLPFWIGLIFVFAIASVYVFLPLANYTDAKDSLRYANRISEARPYFHPNHLLYEPVVYALLRATQTLTGPVDALIVMQWFSKASALPFLICTYLLTWRAWRNVGIAVLATGAVGFSFGVWVFSVSPDGYLPPLFLALLALVLMDPLVWRPRQDGAPMSRVLIAALVMAMAVLLHQMYVILALVIGVVVLARAEFGTAAARLKTFVVFGGVSGGTVLLVYLLAHRALDQDLSFLDWARGYARDGLYYGDPPSLMSPIKGGIGAVSTLLSMNGLLAFDPIADRLMAAFPNKSFYEEHFIAQTAISPYMKVPILMAMCGAIGLWVWLAWGAAAARLRAARAAEYVDTVLLIVVILYTVLVVIWEPTNREFWIQTYVFATIWCARQLPHLSVSRSLTTGALVGCLFFANFFAAMWPLSQPETDHWRVYNAQAIERRDDVDLIVTTCSWLCVWYLRYFAQATVLSPADTDPDKLRRSLQDAAPERVLVSSLAYDPHPLAFVHNPRRDNPDWTAAFAADFPPPAPAPSGDVQTFYGFENGQVKLLK